VSYIDNKQQNIHLYLYKGGLFMNYPDCDMSENALSTQQPYNQIQQFTNSLYNNVRINKHIGLWIAIIALLIILILITWLCGNIYFHEPKYLYVGLKAFTFFKFV
jgi:hypothetical protein